ncbi:MAG TPA: NB-ARC domain-containing protein [Pyrinomonadaceae bacterium]
MDEKIRILFLSANPSSTGRIGVDKEARKIEEMLEKGKGRDDFQLIKYLALMADDLPHLLMKHKPHIVHFSGHGTYAKEIIVEGTGGRSKRIKTPALVEVFRVHRGDIRVVVLNACLTEEAAQALAEVIDYSVGIKRAVGDTAAINFAGAFYLALSNGSSVPKAFASAKSLLKLKEVRPTGGLELFFKEGLDPDEPFPNPWDEDRAYLKEALQHLLDDTATEDETNVIRQATKDSVLTLAQVVETSEVRAEIAETPREAGRPIGLRAELDCATYRRVQERLFPPPPGLPPPLPGLIVIGREDSLTEVRGLIQPAEGEAPELNLTVVRGWPGVGKTTLVGVLGRDPEALKTFPDGVLWTSLERQPELMTKLAEWGRKLGTDEILRTPTPDEAVVKLAALLRHRRMLLIVDDIWNTAHALPFIRAATGSRCALMATTRLTSVAEELIRVSYKEPDAEKERIFYLPVLSEENSLILMYHLAPEIVERYRDECLQLVRDLGCLPLALHVAARLLKAEQKLGLSVVNLIDGIREGAKLFPEPAPADRAEGTVLPSVHALLKRSTDELDPETRKYFAYLGPFVPKPATFSLDAIRAQWRIEDPLSTVRKLVGHGLLEPVGEGRFQMHELLVKHARSLLQ